MISMHLTRRTALLGAAVAAAGTGSAKAAPYIVGYIYVGSRTDYGYNQAQAEGADAVRKLPGVQVVEQAKVAENVACADAMATMMHLDGTSLIFATSFGYWDPYVLQAAKTNPKVTFMHSGGQFWSPGEPRNAHSYFGYIDEGFYVSGIVAGHMTKAKKFGLVAAKPIPQVLRSINAFTLAAQTIDPSITTRVIFTGDWFLPVREAEATNSLADQGVDVISCFVDSPKVVIETAAKRGLYTCGCHANQSVLDPRGYLTGAEWNWPYLHPKWVAALHAGKPVANNIRGGFRDGFIKSSPYGAAVPTEVRAKADAVRNAFIAGTFEIFKGPIKNNKGETMIAPGSVMHAEDKMIRDMDYLVAGVTGTTS